MSYSDIISFPSLSKSYFLVTKSVSDSEIVNFLLSVYSSQSSSSLNINFECSNGVYYLCLFSLTSDLVSS
jgi:hypothetical protein